MFKIFRSEYIESSSQNLIKMGYITFIIKCENRISQNLKTVLKNIRKRSFYKAIQLVETISKLNERNSILEILYSVATYAENNHYVNLMKLWVDDISFEKSSKFNNFLNRKFQKLDNDYHIIIKLKFEYHPFRTKKEIRQ